ncbi:MAG: rRNA pseudouridine synthase [Synergistaceae bacterium]|mgnify:CR=1 FL=1|jgi:23S rRNA pseudouridine2605 synthase|nr:rRNA pseudouridine synthase [Synergistaceae bacterium]
MTQAARGEARRLNRYLAECGLGARRKVEELIRSGRIAIEGKTETEPGAKVYAGQIVSVDGKPVFPVLKRYFLLNKPRGFVCAVSDKWDKTVLELLPPCTRGLGLFPVGRLDKESEGLLILTNDGAFAQKMIHPSSGIHKVYELRLDRVSTDGELEKWKEGALVEGKWVAPVQVERAAERGEEWIRVTLREGRKRELRIMAASHGFKVLRLIRTAIGTLKIGGLRTGEFQEMERAEMLRVAGFGENG